MPRILMHFYESAKLVNKSSEPPPYSSYENMFSNSELSKTQEVKVKPSAPPQDEVQPQAPSATDDPDNYSRFNKH